MIENGVWPVMNLIEGDRTIEVLRIPRCHLSPPRLAHSKHPEDSDRRRHSSMRGGEKGERGGRKDREGLERGGGRERETPNFETINHRT